MKEELNLEPYRQAWQTEKTRRQGAPPKHSEQDILAMLNQHTQQKRQSRSLPLWFGSAAASVAILFGVAWLLWLRPEVAVTEFPTVAELHPTSLPISIPTSVPVSQPSQSAPSISLTTPPSVVRHSITSSAARMKNIVTSNTPDQPLSTDMLPEDVLDAVRTAQASEQHPASVTSNKQQLQAFQETGFIYGIDKQKTPKDMPAKVRVGESGFTPFSNNIQIGLSGGVSFSQSASAQPLVGVTLIRDTKGNGVVCANSEGALYLIFDQPQSSVSLQYGYGLSCRPTEPLTLRLNLGGYLLFSDFDLGLRLNAETAYRLSDNFTLIAGYQYYMPGIVSGDGRHAAMLSVGYIID